MIETIRGPLELNVVLHLRLFSFNLVVRFMATINESLCLAKPCRSKRFMDALISSNHVSRCRRRGRRLLPLLVPI